MKIILPFLYLFLLYSLYTCKSTEEKVEKPQVIKSIPKVIDNTNEIEDSFDSTSFKHWKKEQRISIIKEDIYKVLNQKGERVDQMIRNLTEDELIIFYYAITNYKEFLPTIQDLLKYEVNFKSDKIVLKDLIVKVNSDLEKHNLFFLISYPKTELGDGKFYKETNDFQYRTMSVTLPKEAKEGGMNSEFLSYDYVKEYWFLKNYPKDLKPIVDVIKKVAEDVDYDFSKAYNVKCKIRPGKIGAVCDDYADTTSKYLIQAKIPGLTKIYKISSNKMNHAWNEVIYNGKIVYIDSTWFDINKIDDEGFSINLPMDINRDFDYHYVTYDKNLFNKGFSGKKYSHYLGNDTSRTLVWPKEN